MQTLQALSVPAAIAARRSIRKYKPVAVPRADLNEILRLASLAPSSANIQPWRFVAIQDPELQARLQGVAYNQAQVGSAPALIVLYVDVEDTLASVDDLIHPAVPEERRPGNRQMILNMFANKTREQQHDFTTTQAGIALGFLVLAAQSLGYSTSVMGGFEPDRVREILGLPEGVAIPAIVALGVADEAGYSTHRLPLDRLVRYVG